MGRSVSPDQPGPIDGEADRQVLDRDIVHDLIVGALQEGRIDRGERSHALRRKSGGKSYPVLFGDADVEAAIRVALCKAINARARRHSRRDRANAAVGVCQIGQSVAKHVLIGGRTVGALFLFAGDHVEFGHAVIFVGAFLGELVALALGRDEVQELGYWELLKYINERESPKLPNDFSQEFTFD